MIKRWMIAIFLTSALFACNHRSHTYKETSKLNCILLGGDSVVWYYGNSDDMQSLVRGKISDTIFMRHVFASAKSHAQAGFFAIALKPAAGNNIGEDFRQMVDLLNENDLQSRTIDTLDETERKVFKTISLQEFLDESREAIRHLNLPKEEKEQQENPTASTLTIIPFGEKGTYAYWGTNMKAGKRYTYNELAEFLTRKRSAGNFSVFIRPANNCSYKNTVDVLDLMKKGGIEKYKLIDISKEDQIYLDRLLESRTL